MVNEYIEEDGYSKEGLDSLRSRRIKKGMWGVGLFFMASILGVGGHTLMMYRGLEAPSEYEVTRMSDDDLFDVRYNMSINRFNSKKSYNLIGRMLVEREYKDAISDFSYEIKKRLRKIERDGNSLFTDEQIDRMHVWDVDLLSIRNLLNMDLGYGKIEPEKFVEWNQYLLCAKSKPENMYRLIMMTNANNERLDVRDFKFEMYEKPRVAQLYLYLKTYDSFVDLEEVRAYSFEMVKREKFEKVDGKLPIEMALEEIIARYQNEPNYNLSQ